MRKLLTFGIGLFIAITAYAQEEVEKPDMPYDEENNLIKYEGVAPVKGASKKQLYNNAKKWFNDFYPNANSVIEEKSAEKGKIEGNHKIQIKDKLEDGTKVPAGFIDYDIYLFVRKGKYKYRLTNFQKTGSTPVPIENYYKDPAPKTNRYLQQVDNFVKDLIEDLKKGMHGKKEEKSMDEW